MESTNEKPMGIIVVSHGPFAQAILETTAMLYGAEDMENVYSLCLGPLDDPEEYRKKLENILDEAGEENIIFCDLYGGSPFKAAVILSRTRKVRLFAGVNVPILMEALTRRHYCTADELLDSIDEIASSSLINATKIMNERFGGNN